MGAARLLGCYRTGDANDPETYISAVVSVLSQYPVEVIKSVTEPATGIASKLKWLPAVAEVREACDALMPSFSARWAQEWDANARKLAAERRLQIADQRRKKTYEELVADCNARGLAIGKKPVVPLKTKELDDFKTKYGISQAAWDAIPNGRQEA